MPMLGWVDTGKIKKNGEPKMKRVVFCSRDMKCEFYAGGSDEVREHEKSVHPVPQDNEPPDEIVLLPQLRRK